MAMSSASPSLRTPSTSVPRNQWIDGRSGGGASGCDSCYYPGCRKDANCHCDICVASFNATRDLIHSSSSIIKPKTKTKTKTKTTVASPSSFDSETTAPPSTPSSEPPDVSSSLTVPSSASPPPIPRRNDYSNSNEKEKKKKNSRLPRSKLLVLVAATLAGLWLFDSGFLMVLSWSGGRPKLAPDMVRGFGEGARAASASGFRAGLRIVERKLGGVVGVGGVSNCSSMDSLWKLNQEGGHRFFFLWRCVMYRTAAEELSVWGSPLRTSGLLVSGVSSRSITLLSGMITEWSDAKLVPVLRTGNSSSSSSWMVEKWSSAAVQLEGGTWVLEYQRSAMFQGPGLIGTAWDILRLRLQTISKRLKVRLLVGTGVVDGSYYRDSGDRNPHFEYPT